MPVGCGRIIPQRSRGHLQQVPCRIRTGGRPAPALGPAVGDVQRGHPGLPLHRPEQPVHPAACVLVQHREARRAAGRQGGTPAARRPPRRCASPPLNPCGRRSSNLPSPSISVSSPTRRAEAAGSQRRTSRAKPRCSRTVMVGNSARSCGTYPTPRSAGGRSVTSRPSSRIRPPRTGFSPQTASSSVVFRTRCDP